MEIRTFTKEDTEAVAELSAFCAKGEADFVLNPYWETAEEFVAEFRRFGIEPENHVLVSDAGDGEILGMVGFIRHPDAAIAGMCVPVVRRDFRGRGVGGELLRAAREHGRHELGIRLVTAGIGTRNRAGYSLLTSHGFRPVRQHFLMRCDSKPAMPSMALEGLDFDVSAPGDASGILDVYTACGFEERSLEQMEAALADGLHYHAVARHGERVVAFTEIETHWPQRVWVSYVGVDPELRDRGLGSSLVAWSLQQRFEGGAGSALLMLSGANRTALRAYEKVGFRRHRLIDVLEQTL
ncbi:MAG: GNAT family N-acetyltransferase [Myxococcota bacterium]|nr:GNAT family N-acetyltransferase [Myxococcota bacterium]